MKIFSDIVGYNDPKWGSIRKFMAGKVFSFVENSSKLAFAHAFFIYFRKKKNYETKKLINWTLIREGQNYGQTFLSAHMIK